MSDEKQTSQISTSLDIHQAFILVGRQTEHAGFRLLHGLNNKLKGFHVCIFLSSGSCQWIDLESRSQSGTLLASIFVSHASGLALMRSRRLTCQQLHTAAKAHQSSPLQSLVLCCQYEATDLSFSDSFFFTYLIRPQKTQILYCATNVASPNTDIQYITPRFSNTYCVRLDLSVFISMSLLWCWIYWS